MASNSEKIGEAGSSDSPTATPVGKQSATTEVDGDSKSERIKTTRYPRWTRQETLLLIEAKKRVENRDPLFYNFKAQSILHNHPDPKWNMVSSCVQQHGVKRGAIQCRKRWGNLLTDFRKVKKYESDIKGEGESFWMMGSDKRKENKLPGLFDEVVYRVLDGEALSLLPLAFVKMASKPKNSAHHVEKVNLLGQSNDHEDDEDDEDETFVDTEKMSWSTFEANNATKVTPTFALASPGWEEEPESEKGYKRRRLSPDNGEDTTNVSNDITKVLRRNTKIMKTYLEAQNMNHQMAIQQQKEQSDKLVAVFGKITDAITKIADKM